MSTPETPLSPRVKPPAVRLAAKTAIVALPLAGVGVALSWPTSDTPEPLDTPCDPDDLDPSPGFDDPTDAFE